MSDNVIVVADNTEQVTSAITSALEAALEEIGLVAEGYAKKLCPVDTGRLRNSITHAISTDEKATYIGTNVEYAPYVHEGTSRHKGTPFLTDAATQNVDRYRSILKKHLENG